MTGRDDPQAVAQAFDFAVKAHDGQTRGPTSDESCTSGASDGAHPQVDATTLIAALWHDVIGTATRNLAGIGERIGTAVASIAAEQADDGERPAREEPGWRVASRRRCSCCSNEGSSSLTRHPISP
ncbi:hypothetical protein [Rubellimicrobium aerolatum]|uniref:Uncharacterized protein n=1 Tax=Rubellimicrobium aerolatum TaxID=490979 RepID=A0ABW0S849_9RHOB|nr:hypothetical protein [Rubellimicrobium aerolatum]MBP1804357.1 (p)ppGpp synthase/HD superfamily hydrolase [Rubellimicrobium aerolatum]